MSPREELLPRWDIYEEHLDEASFLWARREQCLLSPAFTLEETGYEEERLMAHLESLAEGGRVIAERLVEPALEESEPERVSAATYTLLCERGPEAYASVLKALEEGDEDRHAAIQRALELWEGSERAERLKPLLASPNPSSRALALEVSAFHGEAPEAATLTSLASHEDVRVQVAALRCAWFLPERARAGFVPAALAEKSPAVRRAGIELGLLCGSRAAWRACGELARTSSSEHALAWVVLALSGGDAELQPVLQGLDADRTRPLALWALGFSGRLAAADACLEMMGAEPALVPLAAEAFSAITGLRIEERYAVTPPDDEETTLPPLEEDDLDANLVPAPEESLPLPAVEAIADWWRQARKQLDPRVRYLHGQPFSGRVLLQALEQASMRRRHVLALELSLRSGGALRLQTRGRVARQYRELREASGALHRISGGTFDKLMTAG